MAKYASHIEGRPKGEFPRVDHIRVSSIALERITGKRTLQPAQPGPATSSDHPAQRAE